MAEPDIDEMRTALLRVYPEGIIRSQFILRMSDEQIYNIYRWHQKHDISMSEPRFKQPKKQIEGQTSLF